MTYKRQCCACDPDADPCILIWPKDLDDYPTECPFGNDWAMWVEEPDDTTVFD